MLLINLFILNYYLIMAKTTINYIQINFGRTKDKTARIKEKKKI